MLGNEYGKTTFIFLLGLVHSSLDRGLRLWL